MLNIKLSQFEGPLDLLLHLVTRAEVDISQIFVSEITAQYLSLMDETASLDMDRASGFIAMAAQLLYIKSRSLLPRPDQVADEEDPEQVLIRQLREYKVYKAAGEKLNELLLSSGRVFGKPAEDYELPEALVNVSGANVSDLFFAFTRLMTKQLQNKAPILREVLRDEYTVQACMEGIRGRLRSAPRIRFGDMFEGALVTTGALISTFMAVLELCALGEICLEQDMTFGEIAIITNV